MIYLTCTAGLCNRLRAIASCILLGRATGHRLSVWWPANNQLNARYSELFEAVPGVDMESAVCRDLNRLAFSPRRLASGLQSTRVAKRLTARFEGKLDGFFYPAHTPLNYDAVEFVRRRRLIFIRSDDGWFYPEDFTWVRPHSVLRERIEQVRAQLPEQTVGVHIRRGDHQSAIRSNPTDLFIQRMSERLIQAPKTYFFVATDDSELRARLRALLGERVITSMGDTSRVSVEGVRNGVVDLFSLAACREIWGTRGSSFSETAHHIGGARLSFPASVATTCATPDE